MLTEPPGLSGNCVRPIITSIVSFCDGLILGVDVGLTLGARVEGASGGATLVGIVVGIMVVGTGVGVADGPAVGTSVGMLVGENVGEFRITAVLDIRFDHVGVDIGTTYARRRSLVNMLTSETIDVSVAVTIPACESRGAAVIVVTFWSELFMYTPLTLIRICPEPIARDVEYANVTLNDASKGNSSGVVITEMKSATNVDGLRDGVSVGACDGADVGLAIGAAVGCTTTESLQHRTLYCCVLSLAHTSTGGVKSAPVVTS
jgi:hypothetical protein